MTIHLPSPTRVLVGTTALALALVLAGCGEDDESGGQRDSAASTPASDPPDEPEPLPITEHVLGAGGLPGFAGQGTPEPQDVRAFAKEHEKSVEELRESGFRSGSTLLFEGEGQEGFGLSVAVEYADPAAAEAEADRLFTSNTEGDPNVRARPLEVPDVPGVRAASMHGSDRGMRLTGVEIVFIDGNVMHEVFAVGEAQSFDTDAVVAAVTALHERVTGHPIA